MDINENKEGYDIYGNDGAEARRKLSELQNQADNLLAKQNRPQKNKKNKEDEMVDPLVDFCESNKSEEQPAFEERKTKKESEELEETTEDVQEKEEPKKKKLHPKPAFFIILAVVAIIIGTVIVSLLDNGKDRSRMNDISSEVIDAPSTSLHRPASSNEKEYQEEEVSDQTSSTPANNEGYLKAIDKNKSYTLSDTLAFAKSINDTTKNYLTTAIAEITKFQNGSSSSIADALLVKKNMLAYDIETIKTYETMFDTYSGSDYIRTAEERLTNAQALYEEVSKEYPSIEDLIKKTNEFIAKENELAAKSKDALIAYLNTNRVTYHAEDDQISYDQLQFYGQEDTADNTATEEDTVAGTEE